MPAPTAKPQVRVPLRCRLGLHKMVELPRPRHRMMRMFVVRRIRGCTLCGAVHTDRFNNPLGGGGSVRSGYLPPAEVKELSDAQGRQEVRPAEAAAAAQAGPEQPGPGPGLPAG